MHFEVCYLGFVLCCKGGLLGRETAIMLLYYSSINMQKSVMWYTKDQFTLFSLYQQLSSALLKLMHALLPQRRYELELELAQGLGRELFLSDFPALWQSFCATIKPAAAGSYECLFLVFRRLVPSVLNSRPTLNLFCYDTANSIQH